MRKQSDTFICCAVLADARRLDKRLLTEALVPLLARLEVLRARHPAQLPLLFSAPLRQGNLVLLLLTLLTTGRTTVPLRQLVLRSSVAFEVTASDMPWLKLPVLWLLPVAGGPGLRPAKQSGLLLCCLHAGLGPPSASLAGPGMTHGVFCQTTLWDAAHAGCHCPTASCSGCETDVHAGCLLLHVCHRVLQACTRQASIQALC